MCIYIYIHIDKYINKFINNLKKNIYIYIYIYIYMDWTLPKCLVPESVQSCAAVQALAALAQQAGHGIQGLQPSRRLQP